MEKGKKVGFTLAEVLITLGIIGVVAAITLPTLVQNYKKQVYVNQLKKTVSTLEQGFKKVLADEGVEKLSQVNDFFDNKGTYDGTSFLLKKYFKGFATEENTLYPDGYYYLDGSKRSGLPDTVRYFYLSDGALVGVYGWNYSGWYFGDVVIDINGDKKLPNTWGRDIFYFFILQNGNLIPYYSKEYCYEGKFGSYSEGIEAADYWRYNSSCGTPDSSTIPSNTKGNGCAARIIENGWKMDY
jgi:prepilin-type N-terminal cleavage/methylation domain-containing protein